MNEETSKRYDEEARRIYAVLLKRDCPGCLLPRYEHAVSQLDGRFGDEELRIHRVMTERIRDWESLEMAARWFGGLPTLVDRFRIMTLLAETLPENYGDFISSRTRRLHGWLALTAAGIRSAWKLVKGVVMISFHKRALKNG